MRVILFVALLSMLSLLWWPYKLFHTPTKFNLTTRYATDKSRSLRDDKQEEQEPASLREARLATFQVFE